jgi:glycosyltransferase involved in cell wall biosynthesis
MSAPRLKLCIVTPHQSKAQRGGAEYQMQRLIDALAQTGRYDVHYLARYTDPQSDAERYRIVNVAGPAALFRFGYAMDALPLYSALKALRPDVIYQRVASGHTGICGYYARRHGTRLIWHVAHDTDVMPGQRLDGRNPLRRFIEERTLEYGIRRATHIVTQTHQQAALLKKNYGRNADAVIANFHPQPTETVDKSGPLRVVWVANLKPWKQPDVFVRLARSLRDIEGVRFVMIGAASTGSGDRAWTDELMGTIKATPNLDYLGELSQDETNRQLARAHVFVNTSLHEGFPNTFIQSWMREVPVVSLHVDPDAVLGREAVGFHAKTESTLSDRVRDLLSDASLRKQYAERAREYALRTHSLRNVQQLLQLIDTGKCERTLMPNGAGPDRAAAGMAPVSSGR